MVELTDMYEIIFQRIDTVLDNCWSGRQDRQDLENFLVDYKALDRRFPKGFDVEAINRFAVELRQGDSTRYYRFYTYYAVGVKDDGSAENFYDGGFCEVRGLDEKVLPNSNLPISFRDLLMHPYRGSLRISMRYEKPVTTGDTYWYPDLVYVAERLVREVWQKNQKKNNLSLKSRIWSFLNFIPSFFRS